MFIEKLIAKALFLMEEDSKFLEDNSFVLICRREKSIGWKTNKEFWCGVQGRNHCTTRVPSHIFYHLDPYKLQFYFSLNSHQLLKHHHFQTRVLQSPLFVFYFILQRHESPRCPIVLRNSTVSAFNIGSEVKFRGGNRSCLIKTIGLPGSPPSLLFACVRAFGSGSPRPAGDNPVINVRIAIFYFCSSSPDAHHVSSLTGIYVWITVQFSLLVRRRFVRSLFLLAGNEPEIRQPSSGAIPDTLGYAISSGGFLKEMEEFIGILWQKNENPPTFYLRLDQKTVPFPFTVCHQQLHVLLMHALRHK